MGKVFGALALILGLIALIASWPIMIFFPDYGAYIVFALCGLAIIFGIFGIIKDDSKGMGIAGLIFGIFAILVGLLAYFLIPVFIENHIINL